MTHNFWGWFLYFAHSFFVQLPLRGVLKHVKLGYLWLGLVFSILRDGAADCFTHWFDISVISLFRFVLDLKKGFFSQKTDEVMSALGIHEQNVKVN